MLTGNLVEAEEPDYMNTNETADYLGIHPATVYRYTKRGILVPHKQPGGLFLFPRKDVEALKLATQGKGPYPYRSGARVRDGRVTYK